MKRAWIGAVVACLVGLLPGLALGQSIAGGGCSGCVLKTGDTMTGQLGITLSSSGYALLVTKSTSQGGIYTDGLATWFGTKSSHPIYFFTADGSAAATMNTSNNWAFGSAVVTGGYKVDITGNLRTTGNVDSSGVGTFSTMAPMTMAITHGADATDPYINIPTNGTPYFGITFGGKTAGTYEMAMGYYAGALSPYIFTRAAGILWGLPAGTAMESINASDIGSTTHPWRDVVITRAMNFFSTASTTGGTYSSMSAANASATNPTMFFQPAASIDANDAVVGVRNFSGTLVASDDLEGDRFGNSFQVGAPATALKVPAVHGNATAQQAIESGASTFTTGSKAVTFGTAFGAAPICVCSDTGGSVLACSTGTSSTTAVTFFGTASDAFNWICIGQN